MNKCVGPLILCALCAFFGSVALAADERPTAARLRAAASRPAGEVSTRPAVPRERRRLGPPQPTRIRVDVFRVTMPYEKGIDFSVDSLRPHANANKELLEALGKEGKATLAYRFDENIDLAEESMLHYGKQEPVIKSVSIARSGTAIPAVDYMSTGCKLKILGLWGDDKGSSEQADVSFVFESKNVDKSSLNIGGGVQAPIIANFESEKSLRAASGQPILSACFDLQRTRSEDDEKESQQFRACIIRLQLDRLTETEEKK